MAAPARGELRGLREGRRLAAGLVWLFGVCALEKSGRKNQLARSKALCALSWNRSRAGGCAGRRVFIIAGNWWLWWRRRRAASYGVFAKARRLAAGLVWLFGVCALEKSGRKNQLARSKALCALSWNRSRAGGCAGRRVFIIAGNWWLWWRRRRAASYGVFAKGGGSPPAWYGSSACARSKNQAEKTS